MGGCTGFWVNVTRTTCAEFIFTPHEAAPLHAPLQDENCQPGFGIGTKRTFVPRLNFALQTVKQLIPRGLLTRRPEPFTDTVKVFLTTTVDAVSPVDAAIAATISTVGSANVSRRTNTARPYNSRRRVTTTNLFEFFARSETLAV